MLYYINIFYIYSIIGYLLEFFVKTFMFKGMNSGILFGPWLPVYGFGGVIIIFMENSIFYIKKIPKILRFIITIISLAFLLSLIEYMGGYLIEKIFQITFWDYSDMKYNIGKYASLEMSLVWSLGSIIIIYLINPICNLFIKKIPVLLTGFVSILFVIDCLCTFLIR